ncbi:MAG TPA: hypothetical protein ENN99_06050 [Chloroflexi bacterium]|nr:hypothetical protein [Chloroflexota bacterium]
MQVRCQRCNYVFTLSREETAAALQEVQETEIKHYNVECPKCRRQVKVPAQAIRRAQPRQDQPSDA